MAQSSRAHPGQDVELRIPQAPGHEARGDEQDHRQDDQGGEIELGTGVGVDQLAHHLRGDLGLPAQPVQALDHGTRVAGALLEEAGLQELIILHGQVLGPLADELPGFGRGKGIEGNALKGPEMALIALGHLGQRPYDCELLPQLIQEPAQARGQVGQIVHDQHPLVFLDCIHDHSHPTLDGDAVVLLLEGLEILLGRPPHRTASDRLPFRPVGRLWLPRRWQRRRPGC
ncbi:MAG: hypothetical protein HYW07_10540 [Candidatus Latescibacteria bacterium]|nr:hypothetical protein [Candidatus Latescibacterota bacterium]